MLEYSAAAAEIFLGAAICVVLLIDVFLRDDQRELTYLLALAAIVGTAVCTVYFGVDERTTILGGAYVADRAGAVLKLMTYIVVAVAFVYSKDYLRAHGLFKGEFFVLGLFGLFGTMVMISAGSLLTLYLGLELLSLSLYALIAFDRDSRAAAESAMKYFVLGAIASGTLLYGISLLYGATGTLGLAEIAARLTGGEGLGVPLLLAIAFIVVGIAFKFGAVPFHMWLPDVYEGAPTPVALYIGTAPKVAAFALAWRVLVEGLGPIEAGWQDMLVVLSVLSLAIGNVVAIAQTNLKRMLGYSTISHVGFILLGFIASDFKGIDAALFYTLTYVLMAAGAFGMILLISRKGFDAELIEDFKGLNARSPWFAFAMLMVMFSMAGVPPWIGFYAKLGVIASIVDSGRYWLAGYAVLFAVIGAFYYLRVVWFMYFNEPKDSTQLVAAPEMRFVMSLNALALLVLGFFPGSLLDLCARVLS